MRISHFQRMADIECKDFQGNDRHALAIPWSHVNFHGIVGQNLASHGIQRVVKQGDLMGRYHKSRMIMEFTKSSQNQQM